MAVTSTENAANLRSANNVAANRLGVDRTNLTYEQRLDYTREVAKVILEHPERFTPATVETAKATLNKNYSPLEDPSFNWEQFAGEVGNEVAELGDSAAGVGEGVKKALALSAWLIPVAVVVAVGILLLGLKKRVA